MKKFFCGKKLSNEEVKRKKMEYY